MSVWKVTFIEPFDRFNSKQRTLTERMREREKERSILGGPKNSIEIDEVTAVVVAVVEAGFAVVKVVVALVEVRSDVAVD